MYKTIIYFLLLLFVNNLFSQKLNEPCLFDHYQKLNKAQILKNEKIIQANVSQKSSHLKIIPVVVHVIHDGGSNNISDQQILSQIEILNQDYRKIIGTNGYGNGVDTEIEFRLAKKDPNGECTNGIVRINSPLSNHKTYQRSLLKQLSFWDNLRYLNIYIVKNINNGSGTLGYSSFPGGPDDEDGIVVRHDYFGNIGTSSSNLGRTTTHEIGHWLGLYHTFNGGCGNDVCSDGDYVCDTPPAINPNYGCSPNNSCSIDFPDLTDQIENYMDYSNDDCKNMLTEGQKQRMHATLNSFRNDIWQNWNIDSTGCNDTITSNCPVIADFVTLEPSICIGNSITFYNKSQNSPITFEWHFDGGSPSTSTSETPTVNYSSIGNFNVKLITSNGISYDTLILLNYINVTTPPIGISLPFFENFETNQFPSNGITIDNPDGGITWELDTTAIAYEGKGSARINNLINTNYGQSDALILPNFNFTSISETPYLQFKWAYARSDANYSDELIVLVSTDCGVNWTQKLYKTGSALATGITQTTPYLPDSNTIWKSANINLGSYSTFQNVLIKLVNVTDGGNNLYIDNILLGNSTLNSSKLDKKDQLKVFPNPNNGHFTIEGEFSELDITTVSIYDIYGRTVYYQNNIQNSVYQNKIEIDLHLLNGLYTIEMLNSKGKISHKFIKN